VVGAAKDRLASNAAAKGFAGPREPLFLEPEDLPLEEDRLREEVLDGVVREESSDFVDALLERSDLEDDDELRLLSEGLRLLNRLKNPGFFLDRRFESITTFFHAADRILRPTRW